MQEFNWQATVILSGKSNWIRISVDVHDANLLSDADWELIEWLERTVKRRLRQKA